jgi:hypothetical protein
MKPIDQLKSVLCDPESRCCIAGSDEDRAIVDRALKALAQPAVQGPLMEPEGKCKECLTYNGHQDGCSHATPPVQDVAAYLFINVQSGDIESSTDPDHKQDELELWYREELVRQHHHTKKGQP